MLDYTIDWGWGTDGWLGADTISAVDWTVPAGLTLDSDTNTTTTATAWLSGGTGGYRLHGHLPHHDGRRPGKTIGPC